MFTVIVATAMPDIGPLVSLVGSVGFSILGVIVPVLMETVWYWYPDYGNEDEEKQDQKDICGSVVVASTISPCGKLKVPVVMANTTAGDTKKMNRRRYFRTAVRNVKNVFLLILSVFALVGGAYYNIHDIVVKFISNGDSPASSVTI